jgi:polyphosphate glucokinase
MSTDDLTRSLAPAPERDEPPASEAVAEHETELLASDEPAHGVNNEELAPSEEHAKVTTSTLASPHPGWTTPPARPFTLAVDVGGTGIKASVLDANDRMVAERVRVATTYPLEPARFVDVVSSLVAPLPGYDRVSIGFPGVVRRGRVVTAPHFVTEHGPGSRIVEALVVAWRGFDLASAVAARLGRPTRVANDADLQGMAVVTGEGLEMVVTLGTGVGSALFFDGVLAPHLELAHHPFRKGETYNEQIGEGALKRIGVEKWLRRVHRALANFSALVNFDRCYVGGGNARYLVDKLEAPFQVVDNVAGILGGIRLWQREWRL